MPELNDYECNQCEFSMPSGSGGHLYVENSEGRRIVCGHPGEDSQIREILGHYPTREELQAMTGFNSYCVCLDCLEQFKADYRDEKVNENRFWNECPQFREGLRGKPKMKDERICPSCQSNNVVTEFELVGKTCPKCKKGKFQEIVTGSVS